MAWLKDPAFRLWLLVAVPSMLLVVLLGPSLPISQELLFGAWRSLVMTAGGAVILPKGLRWPWVGFGLIGTIGLAVAGDCLGLPEEEVWWNWALVMVAVAAPPYLLRRWWPAALGGDPREP